MDNGLRIPAGAGRNERFNGLCNSNHLSFLVQSVSSSSQTLYSLLSAEHMQQNLQHLCSSACTYEEQISLSNIAFNFWGILCFTNNIQAMQQLLVQFVVFSPV